ncbi:MAG: hypothetical protein GEU73_06055 [Chloroflexi bacterium]|nr:hypothetical protein [Chloroflexota bacterium]
MEQKQFTGLVDFLEDKERGSFAAAFSQLGVIDHDGDITVPGAFDEGARVFISAWGHQWGQLTVGKGTIHQQGDWEVCTGQFNLNTVSGREHYESVRFNDDQQEWSFGFNILDAEPAEIEGRRVRVLKKLEVFEVSPVLAGAGIGTHTLAIKSHDDGLLVAGTKAAVSRHHTATSEEGWDGPANERRLPSPLSLAQARAAYAWVDPEAVEDGELPKQAARFIHHEVSGDGKAGAANLRACSTGIAVLNGARGGTTVPPADRSGIYRHLAGHLTDGGKEPPELKAFADLDGSEPYAAHGERVLLDVLGFAARSRSLADLRAKAGRTLSAANEERLQEIAAALRGVADDLDALGADEPTDDDEAEKALAARAYLEFVAAQHGIPLLGG